MTSVRSFALLKRRIWTYRLQHRTRLKPSLMMILVRHGDTYTHMEIHIMAGGG